MSTSIPLSPDLRGLGSPPNRLTSQSCSFGVSGVNGEVFPAYAGMNRGRFTHRALRSSRHAYANPT